MHLSLIFSLCVSVVKCIGFVWSCVATLESHFGGLLPSIRCNGTTITWRRTYGRHSLHLCYFGSISRATRRAKMSIRRLAPVFPPVNSAEKCANCAKCENDESA